MHHRRASLTLTGMERHFINIKGHLYPLDVPKVMGIINVTPDSFYSGSRTMTPDDISQRADKMVMEGVNIFDIGACSSRPGADDVSREEEWRRLVVGLEVLKRRHPDIPVSVDTFRADIARKCVENFGVDIINDISGGADPDMWRIVADLKVPYVLMHTRGNPSTMQSMTEYEDVVAEVMRSLAEKIDKMRLMGIADIIVDPGFGFAKDVDGNYQLLARLDMLKPLGCPILAGMSHKSMIWKTLGITPEESLTGTVVLDTVALMKGAEIIRVHDVKEAVETVKLFQRLRDCSIPAQV